MKEEMGIGHREDVEAFFILRMFLSEDFSFDAPALQCNARFHFHTAILEHTHMKASSKNDFPVRRQKAIVDHRGAES